MSPRCGEICHQHLEAAIPHFISLKRHLPGIASVPLLIVTEPSPKLNLEMVPVIGLVPTSPAHLPSPKLPVSEPLEPVPLVKEEVSW